MATIKDVAKRANVSTTTVSHVINKTRFVAEETRNAVWAAIKELHYSPSAVARSLKVNHTKSIGLLATSSEAAYFAEIIEAVEKKMCIRDRLSNSQDALARRWLLRWGVVLLNCSHVVWQLRDWESRSDPLSRVRDNCISLLRGVMSERGVQQKSLAATLEELQRICDSLARHHQPAARELAAIVWRLYCSLSQLEQAPPQGTLAS